MKIHPLSPRRFADSFRALLIALTSLAAANLDAEPNRWTEVGTGSKQTISGIALIAAESASTSWLVVYDNKGEKDERVAVITRTADGTATSKPLAWPEGAPPAKDLEGLSDVPTEPGLFLAATSRGQVVAIECDAAEKTLKFRKAVDLPINGKGNEFEGFCIHRVGDEYVALWADRGSTIKPATIFWASFDPENIEFGKVLGSAKVRMPWPSTAVRHVSDLKVDPAGVVYVSAAADHGNQGPFQSAVYIAGVFSKVGEDYQFTANEAPTRIFQTEKHKIEALDLLPGCHGGLIFASDDENLGASIYFTW